MDDQDAIVKVTTRKNVLLEAINESPPPPKGSRLVCYLEKENKKKVWLVSGFFTSNHKSDIRRENIYFRVPKKVG
jgi:hypothetical protein